jgi:uncharacterized protein
MPPPAPVPASPKAELPVAYGTGRLLLAARDPHCIYAHWDLTPDQLRHFNALSAHHHLVLRIQQKSPFTLPPVEVPVPAEAWHSFMPVERAGAEYMVELGYHQPDGHWVAAVPQASVLTPPDAPAPLAPPTFATVAVPLGQPFPPAPLEDAAATVKSAALPTASTPERDKGPHQSTVRDLLPGSAQPAVWTAAQTAALAELIRSILPAQRQSGSLDIPDVVQASGATGPALSIGHAEAISSLPQVELAAPRGFWFSVNAELVVYGATDPGAQLTIDGRPVPLRPDGTFTRRLALPDGAYQLSVTARSPAGDSRGVMLQFRRVTTAFGQVGVETQDPSLLPPEPDKAA